MTPTRPASSGRPSAPSPGLAVAAVARRLGVAPATLRTWDRRYGLGPSGRTAGSHRRYTPEDVARLLVMRRLTVEGVAPVDAARAALETEVDKLDTSTTTPGRRAAAAQSAASAGTPDEPEGPRGRGHLRALPGGGEGARGAHATSLPGAAPSTISARVAAVIDAALAYDQSACDGLLRIGAQGDPAAWWTQLVEPAWLRIAQRTVLGTPGEVPELVLATAALRALRDFTEAFEQAMTNAGNPPANHPSRMRKIVLIFAAPDEVVPLAAHALAAALVAHGATARVVTGPASTHRAVELVTMVRPAAVVLATTLARPDLDAVRSVHDAFASLPIFVGLRRENAASELPLAPTVQRVRSFTGLLHEVLAVVG
ncbi:MerR family transcriptional regulator [Xylanimonas protaetiae]|uniref:MerR family transcriptional regulator n=1 Tax=Xylanimonas protaetiae TaxID=2509457 RepID=A0A4P6F3G1_9MICO|nr:MerR family transcriptional regulator [Xylanimonas protaetiae]QAY70142.1 MerR family transcriptional regulator [Xylanimonas protaetiae]